MELITEYRPLIATLAGVAALLVLILRVRMNAFAALILIALLSALAAGMSPESAIQTAQNGMGGTLGFIAPVIGLGALFGALLEASGGIRALANGISRRGTPTTQSWSLGGLGIVASTPVFFDVALIILRPFVYGLAHRSGQVAMLFGLPLCAGLAVGHAFIPPTPGPIAIAELIGAKLGWVILFGSVTGAISMAIAGPIWTIFLQRRGQLPAGDSEAYQAPEAEEDRLSPKVSFGLAASLMLLPLVLILTGTLAKTITLPAEIAYVTTAIGHPFSALLIASGVTWWALRPKTASDKARLRSTLVRAFEPTGAVILVTGAGGAFKQVLVDTGAGSQLADMVLSFGLTPVLAGFALALVVRVAQGSATVSMITAAGLAAPIVDTADLSQPQLGIVTIAIAAGATGFSHVNDSGFWLVSRLFGLTERETLRTWTMSTGLIAVCGLVASSVLFVVF